MLLERPHLLRRLIGALAVAGLVAVGAGCGSSNDNASTSATGQAGASATTNDKKLTVAYIQWAAAAGQKLMATGIKDEAKKFGYNIKVANALGTAANANSLMRTFVTQKVDAIMVDSYSASDLAAGIHAAQAAKIPVYLFYSPDATPQPGVAVSMNVNAGKESAQAIIDQQGENGSVLEFTLPSGANCRLSADRFDEVFKAHTGWKVQTQAVPAPGWAEAAAKTTKAWLLDHPAGKEQLAIWGCWDDPAVGAASALAAAKPPRWDVKVYGQNTSAASARLLQDDHYAVSYWFNTVKVAAHALDLVHERAGEQYDQIKPTVTAMTPIKATPKNIDELLKNYPSILQG